MKNNNNFPIYFSFAIVFGIIIGISLNGNPTDIFSLTKKSSQEKKIKRLINFIEKEYVDNINTDELLDGAITQMLGKLDPHSVYIPKENLQEDRERLQGNFVGIGVQFRMINDSITVIQPIKGGPSILAGIRAGDRILIADKDTLFGKNILSNKVPNYLKGKPGTRVALQIYRKSTDSLFNLAITRGKVNIKSVDLAYMLNDRLGYIKLNRFAENAFTEFKSSLNNLLAAGMTNLVLDLRGNGGGFIHIAERIIDEFLEEDTLIVFTTNNKNETEEYFATAQGDFEKGGLYVLIDENSASASEIVAGALQDNDKGTIIGRRSFGKGLVQEDMDLGDGSFVRLTISRYYTPTGRSIQKKYAKNGNKNYYRESQERISSGELLNKDSIKVVDSLKFITPKGKVVYGGGGIIPDIFVPIDTTSYFSNSYFNFINDFAFKYVDSNRKSLEKWTIDGFIKDFDKSETVLNQYLSTLKNSTAPSFKIKQGLKKYLKAAIANTLFGDVGFYRIIHQNDKMLQKVIEIENSN
tara:strand:- start:559 stop:2130 length:1572 start_codon:yes stop_codon:yes gene_type:complete